jgi:two-component system, OmpR family, sensor kinase
MPLRTALVLVLVALVALGLVAAGGAATAALDRYLVGELDQRLVRAAPGIATDGVPPPIAAGDAPSLLRLFPSSAAFVVTDTAGAVRHDEDALLPDDGPGPDFPRWDLATVRARAAEATDVGSAGPGPRWRLLALPLADGSGSVLVAFSLGDVDATLRRLVLLELLIGAVVVLLVAALAHLVVRRSLRPLTEVERIAAAVAAGEIHLRVPERDPRTEVGRLGRALNVMLGPGCGAVFRVRLPLTRDGVDPGAPRSTRW